MASREASLEAYRGRMARALAYIQENLSGEVTLDGAAAAACFSKFHFHRIFGSLLGETFADYVRRLRLERAALLLSGHRDLSVTEVALAAGFSSPSVLSRDFSARFGRSPTAWREGLVGPGPERPGATLTPPWFGAGDQDAMTTLGPGCRSVAVRVLGPFHLASILSYEGYGPALKDAWSRLYRYAGPRGLLGSGVEDHPPVRPVGMAWDSPEITAPGRCRYSVCLPCPADAEAAGEVVFLDLPRSTFLVLSYRGPDLAGAYARLYGPVLAASGFEPADAPALEFYASFEEPEGVFDLDVALPVKAL